MLLIIYSVLLLLLAAMFRVDVAVHFKNSGFATVHSMRLVAYG